MFSFRSQKNKTYCPIPWVSASVTNQGIYRICCQCNQGPDGGILRDADGQTLNASKDSLEEIRNHPLLKELRNDLLNDRRNPLCKACWDEEDSGLKSKRLSEITKLGKYFSLKDARKTTADDGTIPTTTPMMSLDVRFGNNCNLVCRMCNPRDSRAWYSDHVAISGETHFGTLNGFVELKKTNGHWIAKDSKKFDWYEEDFFWNQIDQYGDQLMTIYMAGGEPLITPKHDELLEKLIELGVAKNIDLDYSTNFTILPKNIENLWREFRAINLGISIDGVGKINDYIRYPSKWDGIENNFEKIENFKDVNLRVYTNTTISALNLPSSSETVKWFVERKRNKCSYPGTLIVHPVYDVHYLNPKVLPKELKEKTMRELLDLESSLQGDHREAKASLGQFINITKSALAEDMGHLYSELVNETEKLDRARGHSWRDYLNFTLTS